MRSCPLLVTFRIDLTLGDRIRVGQSNSSQRTPVPDSVMRARRCPGGRGMISSLFFSVWANWVGLKRPGHDLRYVEVKEKRS